MPTNSKDISKDTVYIDVDDEITAIIEKVQKSGAKIVALVLPKRATVLQSIVNMKLLKRAAENAKKHVVLITTEAGLLPLAGAVGMHVASSLQSRPAIPRAGTAEGPEQVIDEETGEDLGDFDAGAAADKPIGQLAGTAATAGFAEPETIELDNADEPAAEAAGTALGAAGGAGLAKAKPKKDKKLKVPNFNRFRLILVGGIVLLLLLVGGFLYASTAMAKAVVTLKTNSSDFTTKADMTLDPSASQYDPASDTLPAKIVSQQQSGSQQVSTSGQKNNGTRASGTVTLSLNDCAADQVTVPAGTGVSSGGQTFITQQAATLESVKIGGKCQNGSFTNVSTQDVSVAAQSAGAAYNIGPSKFTVAGFSDVSGASSDPMTGGTDNIVKVVTQADIDSAKAKISGGSGSVKEDLAGQLTAAGYYPIAASLNAGDPTVTSSANVGDQADTVTVTQVTTYTMYGAKQADLTQVIVDNVTKQIDPAKQKILNTGFDHATFHVDTPVSSGGLQVTMTATSLAGPDINKSHLAAQLAGKKTGDVTATAKAIPGVTDVSVKYSPFWVSSVPKNTSKVSIVIEKSPSGAHT